MTDAAKHGMTQEEIEAVQSRYGKGPHVAADLVVLTALWSDVLELRVLLIRRRNKPYRGSWALPGGFVDMDEDLETAARRELLEETNIAQLESAHIEQLEAFGHPKRDPRGRTVSAVFMAWVPFRSLPAPKGGDDATAAQFMTLRNGRVHNDEGQGLQVAFDHDRVLACAWERATLLVRHSNVPLRLVEDSFTAKQVGDLYEEFLGPVDRDALLQRLLKNEWIEPAGGDSFRATNAETRWELPTWQRPARAT